MLGASYDDTSARKKCIHKGKFFSKTLGASIKVIFLRARSKRVQILALSALEDIDASINIKSRRARSEARSYPRAERANF